MELANSISSPSSTRSSTPDLTNCERVTDANSELRKFTILHANVSHATKPAAPGTLKKTIRPAHMYSRQHYLNQSLPKKGSVSTEEELKIVENSIKSLIPTLSANVALKANKFLVTENQCIPANKAVEPQRRLFSTTKRKRKAEHGIAKPINVVNEIQNSKCDLQIMTDDLQNLISDEVYEHAIANASIVPDDLGYNDFPQSRERGLKRNYFKMNKPTNQSAIQDKNLRILQYNIRHVYFFNY
ncbi:hypothetical protein TNIN_415151 [Trichonephila inaurata madagascariensis]|uniref:Uncharacterized protein n=1 Tax=Trichonephila inaurata madagascariensis TaxID=2747483 RepID=A0A8X6YD82_9ARAC|nr:hypothetical protein TNIN_415151 [Trichonephila inaurata madagascariensis]